MKKKLCVLIFSITLSFNLQAQGEPVFDFSNLLTAIDTLHANYDMVMNMIQQIEQQYEQYQHFVNEAKSWNLDDVEWDGDWDFRDEIKDVTSSVNKQISNIRGIEEIFTTKQFTLGSMAFTVKDLVGLGDTDRDIIDLLEHAGETTKNTFDEAVNAMVNELSEEQKMAIWRKYGLSPKNFIYMQKKKEMVDDAMQSILASATDEAIEMQTEANLLGANEIMSVALDGEEKTEKELQQQTILMINELIKNVNSLGIGINRVGSLEALRQSLEDEEKQQAQEAQAQVMNTNKAHQDDFF